MQFFGKMRALDKKLTRMLAPFRFGYCTYWLLEDLRIVLVSFFKIAMKKEVFWLFFYLPEFLLVWISSRTIGSCLKALFRPSRPDENRSRIGNLFEGCTGDHGPIRIPLSLVGDARCTRKPFDGCVACLLD